MKKTLFLFALLFLTSVVVFNPTLVSAQAENMIELKTSPPTAYLKIQPGGQASHTVTIENTGSLPVTLQPKLVDFSSDGKTGNPVLGDATTFPYLDTDSVSFTPVTIAPKAKAQLTLHITVPQGAPGKEYPLTILFENTQPAEYTLDTGAGLAASIGSNLIVLVTGVDNPDVNLSLKSLQISKLHDSFRPITFSPLIKNEGMSAALASGSAQIKNWRGTVIATFPIYPAVVLAGSSRELLTETGPFSYKKPFFFGVYTITITLTKGESGEEIALNESHKIIAIPLFFILLSTLIAVGIFFYKRYQNRYNPPHFFE